MKFLVLLSARHTFVYVGAQWILQTDMVSAAESPLVDSRDITRSITTSNDLSRHSVSDGTVVSGS
jgi:hypothetical protein